MDVIVKVEARGNVREIKIEPDPRTWLYPGISPEELEQEIAVVVRRHAESVWPELVVENAVLARIKELVASGDVIPNPEPR